MERPLTLGAFELVEPLRRGGMAEVWRGVHREERARVAIKLVSEERVQTRYLREALQNEVRAMARLDHPGIVRVHDYGEVSTEVAAESEGRLSAGSPYLVMELAEGGTLSSRHATNWRELVHVLSSLLSALAHAHARGVVHRDIKPSNVLVSGSETPTFMLSDFGIAHALTLRERDEPSVPLSAGTAWFMAPEQILRLHRDEGPWTDLYAVGCLGHLLCAGRLPFPGSDREAVYRAHCLTAPPPLVVRFAVPDDYEAWLRVLMAKRPRDRFGYAADALRALTELAATHVDDASAPAVAWRMHDTNADTPDEPSRLGSHDQTITAIDDLPEGPSVSSDERAQEALRRGGAFRVPLLPMEAHDSASALLGGIGLGVYGLRPIPLAGRESECRSLWAHLSHAWEGCAPHVVEVRGRAGLGKTRLGEWLAERASELGAATVLWAGLGPTPSLLEGPVRMLARHLRVENLEREELVDRIDRHPTEPAIDALDDAERARLVDLIAPGSFARATIPEERFAIVERVLALLAAHRPLIAIFDDAHLGRETLAFTEHLLKLREIRLPVLVMLTVQEEALEEGSDEAAILDAIAEHPTAERIELGPLDAGAHAQLVHSILGLEEELARDIARRTAGNPLFAIQLVGDWVQRGELAASRRGFTLREGASLALPDDIHELWSGRLVRLFASLDPSIRERASIALELAALLGRQVEQPEWEAACARAGIEVPEGLLDEIASRRLAHVGRARFSFVHGMLAESLSRRAREDGRWADLHRACARALESFPSSGRAERIGRHLAAAGEGRAAARLLLDAARQRLAICDGAEVHALCALRDEGLARAGVSSSDPVRAAGYVVRAEAAVAQARLDECERWIEKAEPAQRHEEVAAQLHQLRARIALKRGHNEEALLHYARALALVRRLGDRYATAHCLHGIGDAEKLLGRIDESLRHHEEAAVVFDEIGAVVDRARVWIGIADLLRRRGAIDRAVEILTGAVAVTRRMNNLSAVAAGLNTLGDIERGRGELLAAESFYREAQATLATLASEEATIPRLNVGLTQLARDRWTEARETFEAAQRELDQQKRQGYSVFVLAAFWMCDAGTHDWDRYDERALAVAKLLASVPVIDHDLAWLFDRTGRIAYEAGEERRAREALSFAVDQWRALGQEVRAAAIQAMLA